MKINKKIIVPALALAAFAALGVGSTYAIFTSAAETNVAVTAGKVDITASIENLKAYSGKWDETASAYVSEEQSGLSFSNGGTVAVDGGNVTLTNVTPMDKVEFDFSFTNNSTVSVKYRNMVSVASDDGLVSGLNVTVGSDAFTGKTLVTKWTALEVGASIDTIHVTVELPEAAGNEYQGKSATLSFAVSAVQANAKTIDADDSIYYPIYNVNDLVNFQKDFSVNYANYAGKTVALMDNISLAGVEWTPITGQNNGLTFDGQGFTVSNMSLVGTQNVGFFSCGVGCTIKNVNFDNASVEGVNHVAVVAGDGLCTYIENCTVTNSTVLAKDSGNATDGYDDGDKAAAICGYLSAEPNAYVKNCTVSDTTISAYRDVGTFAGMANGKSEVSGNTIGDNVVINVLHCGSNDMNYKSYTTDAAHNADQYAGRKSGSETLENNSGTAVINYLDD